MIVVTIAVDWIGGDCTKCIVVMMDIEVVF